MATFNTLFQISVRVHMVISLPFCLSDREQNSSSSTYTCSDVFASEILHSGLHSRADWQLGIYFFCTFLYI